ncbi:MAG: hypothetical protein AAF456_01975, partial [Planctomycetota bacterium]
NKTTGYGHVYQGRFKSFPVQDDNHFHTVCRYVERNALTAEIVRRAEDYRWGSLWNWCGGDSVIELPPWPVRRLPRWIERVNQPITKKEKDALQNCIKRGCPCGDEKWVQTTARTQGLEITLRPRGRPRKLAWNANLAPDTFFSSGGYRLVRRKMIFLAGSKCQSRKRSFFT